MKTKCKLSTNSKEDLVKAINDYYFSTSWTITDDNKVYNTKLNKYREGSIVKQTKNGKWQLRDAIE